MIFIKIPRSGSTFVAEIENKHEMSSRKRDQLFLSQYRIAVQLLYRNRKQISNCPSVKGINDFYPNTA